MNVAVWRYGLPLQVEAQSTVGGGKIAGELLKTLKKQGHNVTVVGPVSKGVEQWLADAGIAHKRTNDLSTMDAAVVLTGPFNVMYGDGVFDTYRRLATLNGKAIYAQWDVALPFHFAADRSTKFAADCHVRTPHLLKNKEWFLFTQLEEEHVRASKAASTMYATAPFKHVRCLFELVELEKELLKPVKNPVPAIAYFGSDRPGRMRELLRWFGAPGSPPVHLYGQWSEKSLAELMKNQGFEPNIEYRGKIPEGRVTEVLNQYVMTFYMADPAYVKTDFIAQRFFENAIAGVATYYSDKIQPSVRKTVPSGLVLEDPKQLKEAFQHVVSMPFKKRLGLVHQHQEAILSFAKSHPHSMRNAFEQVLS
jgi:hypothetical protein